MNSKKYVKSFEIEKRIGQPNIYQKIIIFWQFFQNFQLKTKIEKINMN